MSVAHDYSKNQNVIEAQEGLKIEYMQALRLVERLHRLLLDVIKDEFDRIGRSDLNSVQALLLFNIGEAELTAGELKTRNPARPPSARCRSSWRSIYIERKNSRVIGA